MNRIFLIPLFVVVLLSSCSLNKLVVGQMTPVLQKSADALYEETDLKLAEQALASNLKLLEGLLKNDPENEALLLLLAQGYSGFALGFVEDEDPARAKVFYDRAFKYGVKVLTESDDDWQWSERNSKKLEQKVFQAQSNELPALFWTTFSLAGKINLSLDDPATLINLPLVEQMINQIEKIDPSFFYGAVYLLKGSIAGMKPRMMGGDPEEALKYFDKNLQITKGTFLLSYIYKAQYYAAKTLNEELFDEILLKVDELEINDFPKIALFNQIARKKAELLRNKKEDLF